MIQIDISLPKTCVECPFVVHKYWYECLFTHEGITKTKRQCKCPLIEIKEGGADMRKPNCVTCDHFGKCDGCERSGEE